MSTTDLFVELIIIGVGAAIWLSLFVFSILGYDWVPLEGLSSLVALVPLFSVAYVLGIVVDRAADMIFGRLWSPGVLHKVYEEEGEYFGDRWLVYIHPGRLGNLLEYGRSRLRICRGWTLNAILILVSLNTFIWTRIADSDMRVRLSLLGSVTVGLFACGNWLAWRQLNLSNYRKAKAQSAFLRAIKAADGPGEG
jgi:hypothetical protein